jgi:hypothetical protein
MFRRRPGRHPLWGRRRAPLPQRGCFLLLPKAPYCLFDLGRAVCWSRYDL